MVKYINWLVDCWKWSFRSFFITYIFKGTITAKWHYWNRKLSLLFFLIPIFLIPELFHLFEKENQSILFEHMIIAHQETVFLTEEFVLIIFVVWVTGAIITSLWFLYWYQQFNKQLKANLVLVPKENTVHYLLHKHMEGMNLAANIKIAFCNINISPALIGIFKPTIVLPKYDIPYDELDMVIKHELTHYKKKDLWIKKAMVFAAILHWYNPFIYFLLKEVNKWSELSCDEDVVIKMSHSDRKKYGETILNMIKRANQDLIPSFLRTSFTTGPTNLKNRLINILNVKQGSKPIVVLSVTVLLALGCVGIVSSALTHENTQVMLEKMDQEDDESTEEVGGDYELISVKKSDESKFSKKEWEEILKQIENNKVILEDESRE